VKAKQTIYDLLECIRKRPGFYLRSPTLRSLYDFLTGFSVGQNFAADAQNGERPFGDFKAWFSIHLDAPCAGAGGWYGAISDESGDGKKGFDRFFEYLTIYRQRVSLMQYHFRLTPGQRRLYVNAQRAPAPDQLRLTRYQGERCLFLHARGRGRQSWYMHGGFDSVAYARRSLTKTFGITDAQWRRAKRQSDDRILSRNQKPKLKIQKSPESSC